MRVTQILLPQRTMLALVLLMFLGSMAPAAETINLKANSAMIKILDRPVSTVILGNQEIADVTLQTDKRLVFTPKQAGTTNVLILDNENRTILEATINVDGRDAGKVEIYPQVNRNALHNYFAYYCPPSGGLCQRVKDELESLTHLEKGGPQAPQQNTPVIQEPSPQQQDPQQ